MRIVRNTVRVSDGNRETMTGQSMRHKTNWERVMSAIESITGKRNAEAVQILREELGPKYARIVEKRAAAMEWANAYRATPEGQRKILEYAHKYYHENKEKCNAATKRCRQKRMAGHD